MFEELARSLRARIAEHNAATDPAERVRLRARAGELSRRLRDHLDGYDPRTYVPPPRVESDASRPAEPDPDPLWHVRPGSLLEMERLGELGNRWTEAIHVHNESIDPDERAVRADEVHRLAGELRAAVDEFRAREAAWWGQTGRALWQRDWTFDDEPHACEPWPGSADS